MPLPNPQWFARRVLWCLLALVLPCSAAPTKDIEVRFAAQAKPARLGDLVMVTEEVRSDPFSLPVNNLTDPQVAPARAFRLEMEGKEGALATVILPETGTRFIILLVPGVKSVFDAVVIAARDGSFRPGDFYLHNVSKKQILGMVGTTRFTIPSRKGQVVRPKGAREERFYDVTLGVREEPQPRVISTSRWPVNTQMRTYVFFFDNPKRGDVDFRAIDEFVPPEGE
jgi:hypothetical protein